VIGESFPSVLAAAQAGDEAAFTTLFRDVQPALLRYLRVMAAGAAEDVAAETWLAIVKALPDFIGEEDAFRGWVFTIARRRMIDWSRAIVRQRTTSLDDGAPEERAPDTGDVAVDNLATEQALKLLAELPSEQAEIIFLRVVAGLDVAMVAELVGKSPGAVRVAAHRGLRKLATLVDRSGVTK
jgi:RNA polymerase sigma-70 factor (ECF subfamily)